MAPPSPRGSFRPTRYSIHLSHDHVVQRVGIVVRRGISLQRQSRPHRPRPRSWPPVAQRRRYHASLAAAVACPCRASEDRLLRRAAHHQHSAAPAPNCASRCRRCSTGSARARAEGVAFAILGDFNRHMDGRDQFWSALRQAAPLTRATEGRASPCWGGEAFIDHIMLGNAAREWLLPDIAARADLSRDRRGMEAAPVGSLPGVGALAPAGLTTLNAAWREGAAA